MSGLRLAVSWTRCGRGSMRPVWHSNEGEELRGSSAGLCRWWYAIATWERASSWERERAGGSDRCTHSSRCSERRRLLDSAVAGGEGSLSMLRGEVRGDRCKAKYAGAKERTSGVVVNTTADLDKATRRSGRGWWQIRGATERRQGQGGDLERCGSRRRRGMQGRGAGEGNDRGVGEQVAEVGLTGSLGGRRMAIRKAGSPAWAEQQSETGAQHAQVVPPVGLGVGLLLGEPEVLSASSNKGTCLGTCARDGAAVDELDDRFHRS
ncbi:hypothetical protein BDV96DRAFT_149920 [Lophiotrema nucula]|uniref:Uncharacterized protein n=1 Tax=Lophiotrema nucula TaxID=690887 RepID=A0A6A5Z0X8_9PLEO|nr:hypothetical protein BDV96DRAFT_149920 [Lophiotrema nucula]